MPIDFTRQEFDELLAMTPIDRAKRLTSMISRAGTVQHRLANMRAMVLDHLRQEGWTLQQIADELGVTRQQIHRLVGSDGTVTVQDLADELGVENALVLELAQELGIQRRSQ